MLPDIGLACFINKVYSRFKYNGISYVGGAGFKFVRNVIEYSPFKRNFFDHFSSAKKWRHCFQYFLFTIKNTNACRTIHFVCRKRKEITVQFLNVDI